MLMGIVSQEEETDAAGESRENRIIPAMSRTRWDPGENQAPSSGGPPSATAGVREEEGVRPQTQEKPGRRMDFCLYQSLYLLTQRLLGIILRKFSRSYT